MQRLMRSLTRLGFLTEEEGMLGPTETDDMDFSLMPLHAASCTYRIALGPRAGQKVLKLKTLEPVDWHTPSDRCVSHGGFSLHANTTDRKKLERLCRYITRPVLANERVKIRQNRDVVLKLKSPYQDGTTHLVMTPLEFLQKLAALVPRPQLNLTRYHGVLAPNAKLRSQVVPKLIEDDSSEVTVDEKLSSPKPRKYISCARLLKRVFNIDIETCPHCPGKLKIIAVIEDPSTIVKILKHLGLPARARPRAPANYAASLITSSITPKESSQFP